MALLSKILVREEMPGSAAALALRVSLVLALGTAASLSPSMPALGHEYEYVKVMDASDLADDADGVGAAAEEPSRPSATKEDGASANEGTHPKDGDASPEEPQGEAVPPEATPLGDQGDGPQDDDAALDGTSVLQALSLEDDGEGISLMAGGTVSVNSQASFANALASLDGQGTISISSNFTVSSPVSIPAGANITIKLNGHTLTGTASSVLDVGSGATLTVTGPGTMRNTDGNGHVFSASSHVGSLSLNGSAKFLACGNVFNDIAWFTSTFIAPGCAFSGTQGLLAFKDNYQEGQEIVYSNGEYVLRYWPDPDAEVWYARALFVYFPTEADYESYVHQFGTADISMPTIKHTVTFKMSDPDRVVSRDEILQGHCFDSKIGVEGDSAPTNEQMQALAPKDTTFKGWLDSKGKLYTIDQIRALPVMDDLVYTAKFEKNPVGPVDPKPVDPQPSDPDVPVEPKPVSPDVPVGPGQELVDTPDIGAENAIRGSGAGNSRTPQNPFTPWNPPGLAVAAGFTVPTSGPGVVMADESQLTPSAAGSGNGDDDSEDVVSPFSTPVPEEKILPFTGEDVASTLGLAGGTVLAALLVSRVQMFLRANEAAEAATTRRSRTRSSRAMKGGSAAHSV